MGTLAVEVKKKTRSENTTTWATFVAKWAIKKIEALGAIWLDPASARSPSQ